MIAEAYAPFDMDFPRPLGKVSAQTEKTTAFEIVPRASVMPVI